MNFKIFRHESPRACARRLLADKFKSEKGSSLVLAYLVMAVLVTFTVSFAYSTVQELNQANRYRNTTAAFWMAEEGGNRFMNDTTLLNGVSDGTQVCFPACGGNHIAISKDDSHPSYRVLTAVGTFNGITRTIQTEFAAGAPASFDNTISGGGNLHLQATVAGIDVDAKTRLTGSYSKSGFVSIGLFDDKVEGVDSSLTTLEYPDSNTNGTPDEFNDFVEFNRDIVSSYPPSEVVYIQGDSTIDIWPSSALVGKKVVFVEGSAPGSGDVNILFDSTWTANQDLTVISTGSVNYIQPLQNPSSDSQLNTISWDDYNEGAIFYSTHSGVTYTHGDASFGSILSISQSNGSMIVNGNTDFFLVGVWKKFYYENPLDADGLPPPGFEGLIGGGGEGYSDSPSNWIEL